MLMRKTSRKNKRRSRESGQAAVFLVLAMGLFLIGSMGFVVDGANLWFHRQSAQTAADAACTAGAMKMLSVAAGATPPDPNWIGNSFQCSGSMSGSGGNVPNSGSAPCQYAAFNGYSSSGLKTNQAGTDVSVTFPGSFSSIPACPNGSSLCNAEDIAATPYLQVNVTDRVQTTFLGLLNGGRSVDVGAQAMCGLSNVLSAVPVLVLNPNAPNSGLTSTMTAVNPASLTILNGPQTSIQVNSNDANAVNLSSVTVDLSGANGGDGGNFALAGRESQSAAKGVGSKIDLGGGEWVQAAGVISDPFASVPAPALPAPATAHFTEPSCPGISGISCEHYFPGYYPIGITVPTTSGGSGGSGEGSGGASGVAIFDPGIYYLDGDFVAGAGTCLRPNITFPPTEGTVFYLHGASSLQVNRLSGGASICPTTTVPISSLQCTASGNQMFSGLPAAGLSGNVLLAPCTGPYGDPTGDGTQRGMLFFHDRDTQPAIQPKWRASGSFGLVGNVYFHYCNSSTSNATGSGANCDPNAFTNIFNLGSGSPAYIVGDIVVDQLQLGQMGGPSTITVSLNPSTQYRVLKASLLQ
jgi:Putative Flp pilus-assembly TadE/G-like